MIPIGLLWWACHTPGTEPPTETAGSSESESEETPIPESETEESESESSSETETETESESETESEVIDDTSIDTIEGSDRCKPGASVYVEEGHGLVWAAACEDATVVVERWDATGLPAGAIWDPTSATLHWTPDLDDAGRHDVSLVAWTTEGPDSGTLKIWVADAWTNPDNVLVNPEVYQEEYDLPVVFLSSPVRGWSSAESRPTEVVYKGHTFAVEAKLRGAASLGYPKNSYTIEFPPKDEFEDDEEDFDKRRKIVLTTTFDDNAYVRQRLCFEIWNRLDPTHHQVQTMFAVVYLDGVYHGLYLLGDHIDGEYWEDWGHREDGNLYKAVDHNANFYMKNPLYSGYEKKEGLPESGPGAFTDLEDLVRFVGSSDATTYRAELPILVALPEFMDWWNLVRFTESGDSAGKNSYLYNDPKDPLWHYAPWDFNHSLGQDWQTLRVGPTAGDEFKGTNNLFKRTLEDAVHGPEMMTRWRTALDGAVHHAMLDEVVMTWIEDIDPSARRDWAKWQPYYVTYGGWSWRNDWTSYDEELAYVRGWIEDRWVWLDSQYP